jgi:hypothetical protein
VSDYSTQEVIAALIPEPGPQGVTKARLGYSSTLTEVIHYSERRKFTTAASQIFLNAEHIVYQSLSSVHGVKKEAIREKTGFAEMHIKTQDYEVSLVDIACVTDFSYVWSPIFTSSPTEPKPQC